MKKQCIESVGAVKKKNFLKKSKGITLISLVIMMILLLMLAGIALQALTGSGLFGQAAKAKENAKLAEIKEKLRLSAMEVVQDNNGNKATLDDFYKKLEDENIKVSDKYKENNKDIIEIDDKYVFEVVEGDHYIKVDEIGIKQNLTPMLILESITNTTNSITVKVSTKRNEGGKLEFYIKAADEEKYRDIKKIKTENNADNLEFTYTGLDQNKKYNVKIVAVKNKLQTEVLVDKTLEGVTNLTTANVTFTYDPSSWTNGNVKVTAALKDMTSSYTLKITDSNPVGASKTTALGWKNAREGITVDTNKTIYAVLIDNEGQIGGAATGNVDKIDKQKPVANVSGTTTNSITFTGTDTAKTGEKASGIAGYIVKDNNTVPGKDDSAWKSYNGASKIVSGLTQGKTYYVFVKDNAGNVSVAASRGTGSVTISKGNITSSVKSWNGTTATVEFKTTTGYYIQTKVGNGNWSSNPSTVGSATANATTGTTVYARLTDSTGQYNNGDAASITPVLKYTIEFNSNGGSGSMGSLTERAYGTSYTLTSNSFTKSGSHFKGWNTKADGSGTTYSDKASVKNLTTTNGSTVTLYAIWEQHSYSSSVTTAATCTTNGTRKYTCTVCGNNYTETIAALGHTGNEGGSVTQSTSCTRDGYRHYRCTRCHQDYGGTYKYENAWGHDFSSKTTTSAYLRREASCTFPEEYYYKCTRCDAKGDDRHTYTTGKYLAHDWRTSNDKRSDATCAAAATYWYRCASCGQRGSYYNAGNALGHYCSRPNYAYNNSYHIYGYCDRCGSEMISANMAGRTYHNIVGTRKIQEYGVHGGSRGYWFCYCTGCGYGYNGDTWDDRIGHDLNAAIYNGVRSPTGHQYTRACLRCWNEGKGVVNNEGIAIHRKSF